MLTCPHCGASAKSREQRGDPAEHEITESGQHLPDDIAVDISEAVVAALKLVRQTGVFKTEQVKRSRVEVVNVHRIPYDVVTEIICLTMDISLLHARSSHPNTEAAGMMITAVVRARQDAL